MFRVCWGARSDTDRQRTQFIDVQLIVHRVNEAGSEQ